MAGNLSASAQYQKEKGLVSSQWPSEGDEDVLLSVQVAQVVQVSGVSTTQKQTRTQHET